MMKLHAVICAALLLAAASFAQSGATPQAAPPESASASAKQPVLVVLFARLEDHVNLSAVEQRLFRLFKLADEVRHEYPGQPFKVRCEFSGTVAEKLAASNSQDKWADRIAAAVREGWLEVGYSGRHEPTYRNRPRAVLNDSMTPEERWLARSEAASRFLTEHKDFLTGAPDAGASGGLKRVAEVFGPPLYAADFSEQLGVEHVFQHQMRRLGVEPVLSAFPQPHFYLNLHGYAGARHEFTLTMAPAANAAPELFWDGNFLRLSFASLKDLKVGRTADGAEAAAKIMADLDRSHVRIVQVEILDEERFLNLLPDGTPRLHPLVWAYDHPEQPIVPSAVRAFQNAEVVEPTFARDYETVRWLLGKFFPANPGSRLVSMSDLRRIAETPFGQRIGRSTVDAAARDFLARLESTGGAIPGFVKADGRFFSAGDLFQLLAGRLATPNAESLPLGHIYGALGMRESERDTRGMMAAASEVRRLASDLVPRLTDTAWKPVPANVVPTSVLLGGKNLTPSQFLILMARAVVSPKADTFEVPYQNGFLLPGMIYPRHIPVQDAVNMWTLRPAPLNLSALGPVMRTSR